jgi:hypothetical protein
MRLLKKLNVLFCSSLFVLVCLVAGLIFTKTHAQQVGNEVALYDIDFSKGNAGFGVVSGGKFVPEGWTIVDHADNIYFNTPQGTSVEAGSITVAMTNVDPHAQMKAVNHPVGKNQFIAINEKCDGGGIKIRFRQGTNYPQIKTEISLPGRSEWIERVFSNVLPGGKWDLKETYRYKVAWDSKGFRLSVNDKVFQEFPNVPKGFCTLRIGETFPTSSKAFPGPIYKYVKFVSISGKPLPPTPTPTPTATPNTELTHTIELKKDWNLISLPIQPSDDDIADVLASISGKYVAVHAYNGTAYESYYPGNASSTLSKMTAGRGYWVYMTEKADLQIKGTAAGKSIALNKNWNLVGYNSLTPMSASQALASTGGKATAVYSFNANANKYDVVETFKPGEGYWIFASDSTTWTLP